MSIKRTLQFETEFTGTFDPLPFLDMAKEKFGRLAAQSGYTQDVIHWETLRFEIEQVENAIVAPEHLPRAIIVSVDAEVGLDE